MTSIVFLLLLGSVNSLEIEVEHLDKPEGYVTKYKPNAHPEAGQIHVLLDAIDKRIFDSIKAAAWANITETNNIFAEKVSEFHRLGNITENARNAYNAAVSRLTAAKTTLDKALADKNTAEERRNNARATHNIASSNLQEAESALADAKDQEKKGTERANDEFSQSLGTLKAHATGTFFDLCKEIDLIHRIRLLVEEINTEYAHEAGPSRFLESCKVCIANAELIDTECTAEKIIGTEVAEEANEKMPECPLDDIIDARGKAGKEYTSTFKFKNGEVNIPYGDVKIGKISLYLAKDYVCHQKWQDLNGLNENEYLKVSPMYDGTPPLAQDEWFATSAPFGFIEVLHKGCERCAM